jgi:hypothetical protein
MSLTTWVRVEDAFAQFDHPKGARLPKGVRLVEGADEYVGNVARPAKPFTDKDGNPTSRDQESYDRLTKSKLQAEIDKRTRAGRAIEPEGSTNADLVAALVADDVAQAAETSDANGAPDTGDHTNTSGHDAAGSE